MMFRLLIILSVLFLAACGTPAPPDAASRQATVEAQVRATLAAQQAATSPEPTVLPTEPTAAEEASPTGTPTSEGWITQEEFGENWPLTVPAGELRCDGANGFGAVTFSVPGRGTYAVNGIAKGRDRYPDVDEIWADDPDLEGLKKDLGPLIQRGLALCE